MGLYATILSRIGEFAWLIIMVSEFVDSVYWHFFTIAVNYKGSDIELLLNDVCLINLYEESQTDLSLIWISHPARIHECTA
jgi:hypothetical protein